LARLQTVTHGRDRTNVVRHREKDELLIDEIREGDFIGIVVEIGARLRLPVSTESW
jgi:hypothetical protein